MRHCSVSACERFVPGPMIASAPPICPKSALSPLPLIRPPTTFPTTRIREDKLDAFGVPGHHPTFTLGGPVGGNVWDESFPIRLLLNLPLQETSIDSEAIHLDHPGHRVRDHLWLGNVHCGSKVRISSRS